MSEIGDCAIINLSQPRTSAIHAFGTCRNGRLWIIKFLFNLFCFFSALFQKPGEMFPRAHWYMLCCKAGISGCCTVTADKMTIVSPRSVLALLSNFSCHRLLLQLTLHNWSETRLLWPCHAMYTLLVFRRWPHPFLPHTNIVYVMPHHTPSIVHQATYYIWTNPEASRFIRNITSTCSRG